MIPRCLKVFPAIALAWLGSLSHAEESKGGEILFIKSSGHTLNRYQVIWLQGTGRLIELELVDWRQRAKALREAGLEPGPELELEARLARTARSLRSELIQELLTSAKLASLEPEYVVLKRDARGEPVRLTDLDPRPAVLHVQDPAPTGGLEKTVCVNLYAPDLLELGATQASVEFLPAFESVERAAGEERLDWKPIENPQVLLGELAVKLEAMAAQHPCPAVGDLFLQEVHRTFLTISTME